jgi:hypothetical protein
MAQKIALDGTAANQAVSRLDGSHAEIPAAGTRTDIDGNKTGAPSQAFHTDFTFHVNALSTQVQTLQDQVAKLIQSHREAIDTLQSADAAAKDHVNDLAALLDPNAQKVADAPTSAPAPQTAPAPQSAPTSSSDAAPTAPAAPQPTQTGVAIN